MGPIEPIHQAQCRLRDYQKVSFSPLDSGLEDPFAYLVVAWEKMKLESWLQSDVRGWADGSIVGTGLSFAYRKNSRFEERRSRVAGDWRYTCPDLESVEAAALWNSLTKAQISSLLGLGVCSKDDRQYFRF
jgi:hypothetical protein